MKRLLTIGIAVLALALSIAAGILSVPAKTVKAEGTVEINEDTFPDERFRYWLKYTDYGDDGILTDSEIAGVESIIIKNFEVTSLKGIEYFTSLKTLYCFGNEIESLDLSKNTALEKLSCDRNNLTALDLSNQKELTELSCNNNQSLTSLDLSNNTALKTLDCSRTKLKSLDVSMLTELRELNCYSNKLEILNVSNNRKLISLSCYSNKLKSLDVSNNVDLRTLSCENNDLESLKLGYHPSLSSIYCYNNKLTSIETKEIFLLEKLNCHDNSLESLDVSRNIHLSTLYCQNNPFTRFYSPDKDMTLEYDDGTECIKLSYSDWTYLGADWNIDINDPAKATAVAKFSTSKDIREDCQTYEPMTMISFSSTDPDCENDGSLNYRAVVVHYVSRTGEYVSEEKTVTIPAKGHKWSSWTVTKPATLDSDGVKTRTCSVCGKTDTVKIARLTPTPAPTKAVKPTGKPDPTNAAKPTGKPSDDKGTQTSRTAYVVCGKKLSFNVSSIIGKGTYSWKSSDSKIASVDSKGVITALMAGPVTVTVTNGTKKFIIPIVVLYKDVTDSKDFWYEPTNSMTAKGVVKGYDKQTKFKPANECTRAQMVTFIWRLVGSPSPKAKTCKFSDVKKTDYFYKACIWGNEKGIVEGYKDGTFGPQIVCARRHAVTFLWRLAGKPAPKSSKNNFKDVKKSDYYYKATLWASEKKILAGYSDGTFRPNGNCLRRQMVTFLYKYDKFVNG